VSRPLDALVIGSGPNGLAAAVRLAQAGCSVKVLEAQPAPGGGARSAELTLPGFVHDVCSAIHPLAAASPFFKSLALEQAGLELVHGEVPLVHPLEASAAVLRRSVEETAAGLGADERAYRSLMQPLVDGYEDLAPLLFNPVTRPPLGAPLLAARFGLKALRSAEGFARGRFVTEEARALFAGCAAHSFAPLTSPLTASFGLVLQLLGHVVGWPLIRGGSGALVKALVTKLRELGGELEVGRPVTGLAGLPEAKLVLFDTHAHVMAKVCGDALPASYQRALAAFRRGPGVFKLDYALSGPMPWARPECAKAPTVHLGGTLDELTASEAAPAAGRVPEKPYVLVAQQSLFDASRAPPGQHTLWAYCHVPNGSTEDATAAIEAQLERHAPGFSRLVLARAVRRPADLEAHNASCVGGDISGGAVDGRQLFVRPAWGRPYATPNPRVLLCSSSAPPGPGVHGMCGFWAAELALKRLR